MISAEIKVYGIEPTAFEMEAQAIRASDLTPIWAQVDAELRKIEVEQFSTRGARSGHPWPEDEISTIARKWMAGQRIETLRATDAMYDALTGETDASVREGTPDSFEFGADLEQFRIHQDPPPDAPFPERNPVDLTVHDELMLVELIQGWVAGARNVIGQHINPATGRYVKVPR